ncbi:uncharacterized protein LOC133782219 isoform X2 [Humulus lupulus]|uniref:uncharacterized protein LOC133782219 isoform X2 n=1 Tax=Humulus lupulus TaxID=3486 RepID=UPI002B40BF41|nr:uncharacterized protein LOC133782219 isoform X2 [Humulus lupulus]
MFKTQKHFLLPSEDRTVSPMAASESLFFSIFLALTFAITLAEPSLPENFVSAPEVQGSTLGVELELLKSRIASLEMGIDERNHQLSEKDKSIKQMQKTIQVKADNISLLQIEIKLLRESLYGKEYMSKPDQQEGEIEKQVERLRTDIDKQSDKKYGLGARAYVAEKKIQQMNSKLKKLYIVNDEQETIIHKIEHLLQVAEEELMKAEVETAWVHLEWLPHWLSAHLGHIQLYIEAYWIKGGKQVMDILFQKALEMKAQVEDWIKLQIEMIKVDWVPILKEQWLVFVTFVKLCVQLLMEKLVDMYHVAKNYFAPHAVKVSKDLVSYAWEAKNLTVSFLHHTAMVARSLLTKTYITLKPYTIKMLNECKTFMTFLARYHYQAKTFKFLSVNSVFYGLKG